MKKHSKQKSCKIIAEKIILNIFKNVSPIKFNNTKDIKALSVIMWRSLLSRGNRGEGDSHLREKDAAVLSSYLKFFQQNCLKIQFLR